MNIPRIVWINKNWSLRKVHYEIFNFFKDHLVNLFKNQKVPLYKNENGGEPRQITDDEFFSLPLKE